MSELYDLLDRPVTMNSHKTVIRPRIAAQDRYVLTDQGCDEEGVAIQGDHPESR